MRGVALGSIRTRVERLASGWPTSSEPLFVHWIQPYEQCPSCAADLDGYAQAAAWARAVEGLAPGAPPPALVFYGTDELTTCPRSRVALAS